MELPIINNLLTHSQMTAYKTCPRKTYFSYELGIRPEWEAKPLRFGSAVHLGLDLMAKGGASCPVCGGDGSGDHPEIACGFCDGKGVVRELDKLLLMAVASYESLPNWCNTAELIHAWAIERETVIQLLIGYRNYWQDADQIIEIVESEHTFNVPILNSETGRATPAFRLGGKRDKIIIGADGRKKLREHKTTSEDLAMGSDYWQRWRIDQQVSAYYIAAEAEGIKLDTVEIDAIRKPTIGPLKIPLLDEKGVKIVNNLDGTRAKKANGDPYLSGDEAKGRIAQSRMQTPEEFGVRLAEDIESRPEFYFRREEIPRLASDLAEFREELWQIQQQYGDSRRRGRWFRNTAACRSFGTACAYFKVCTNGVPLSATSELPPGFVRVHDVHPELATDIES